MLLRHSLDLGDEADAVENAIAGAIGNGARTADIAADGEQHISTEEMTAEIIRCLS